MPFVAIRQPGASVPPPRARPAPAAPQPETVDSGKATNKRVHHKVARTGPNWDENGDYIVGKGRPPKTTRWIEGQSGNPKGPAKRETLSPQDQFEQTFLAPFKATVNGETVPLTMDVFAVQALKNSAVKGSVRAAQILLDFYATLIRKVAEQEPGPQVDMWEQDMIDRLLAEFDLPKRPVVRATDRSKGPA